MITPLAGSGIELKCTREVLQEAAKREMTREERREQRISFIMGMLGSDTKISREYVAAYVDEEYA